MGETILDPLDKAKFVDRALRGMKKQASYEEGKERKRRSAERRANGGDPRPRKKAWSRGSADELDDFEAFEPERRGRRGASGSRVTARGEGRSQDDDRSPAGEASKRETGTVAGVTRGRVRVLTEAGEIDAELAPELARTQQSSVAVGDEVELVRPARAGGLARVVLVHERRARLSRPDPANPSRELVLAANVDLAVLVASVVAPPFRPALLDRFLVALSDGGVAPALCVNKVDLLRDARERDELEALLEIHRSQGVPCLATSVATGEGIAELARLVAGRTCVFTGHSGVGKSSLFNALDPVLDPGDERATGSVRAGDGKGRHTTSTSCLRELADGTRIVDTPGVRAFGLWRLDRAALRRAFGEFDAFACRFRDCAHTVEPDCGVRAAAASGALAPSRLAAYLRLLAELG